MTGRQRLAVAGAALALTIAGTGVALAADGDLRATCTSNPKVTGQTVVAFDVHCSVPRPTTTVTHTVTVTQPPVTVTQTVTATPSTTTTEPEPTTTATAPATTTTTPAPDPTTTTPDPDPTTPDPVQTTGGRVVLGRSFPDSTTTGVPPGTQLTPYTGSCTLSNPNAAPVTIDRKIITCDQFRILQPNVTITNSVINGTVYSDCCYLNGSFNISDSDIRGPNSSGTVVGEARFTLTRVEVTGGSRSVFCNIDCTVRDSYLHGQYTDLRGIDHESGIRMDNNLTLVHNQVTCDATPVPPDAGCSAAISGYGDFGVVQNNTIENNLIDGGPAGSMGYCVYGGSVPGKPYPHANHIVYRDNVFMRGPSGKCGIWGPVSDFTSTEPGNVWENNLWDDGRTVPPDH